MKINAQANKNCENYKKRLHQQARNCYKSLLKEEKDKKKEEKTEQIEIKICLKNTNKNMEKTKTKHKKNVVMKNLFFCRV